MTPTPSDTIRTRLAFAYEAAETEEDRAWVNEGQEALAMMEAQVERLTEALEFINKRGAFGIRELDDLICLALAHPGDAA